MTIKTIDLRRDFEIEQLEVIPNEAENEIRFSMRATIRNLDEEVFSAVAGERFELETVTIRIVN